MSGWAPAGALTEIALPEMWQRVAGCGLQFLLIGESDHRIWQTGAEIVKAIPVLAGGGFAHLGLEWQRRTLQPVIDFFNAASASDRANGADMRMLTMVFTALPGAAAQANPAMGRQFVDVNKALLYLARQRNVQAHALNMLPGLGDFIGAEKPDRQERFMRALVDLSAPVPSLARLQADEEPLFRKYLEAYMTSNLAQDKSRATLFQAAAGTARAMVMHGPAHFRGEGQGGIDDFLPADRQIYVLLGAGLSLQEAFAETRTGTRRAPDFVADVLEAKAWLMPAAKMHALV